MNPTETRETQKEVCKKNSILRVKPYQKSFNDIYSRSEEPKTLNGVFCPHYQEMGLSDFERSWTCRACHYIVFRQKHEKPKELPKAVTKFSDGLVYTDQNFHFSVFSIQ